MPRFGLTGSRHFGSAKADSDTDLFTQDSPAMRAHLLSLGFRKIDIVGSGGPNNRAVFRLGKMGKPGRVDVAMMRDFDRKAKENAIASIAPLKALMRLAPKRIRAAVWWRIQKL